MDIYALCSEECSEWVSERMDDIFRPRVKFFVVYIDDILVFSKHWKDHIDHLEQFYDLVYNHGLVLS